MTTPLEASLKPELCALIPYGRENAIRSQVIADHFDLPERTVRKIIRELIIDGLPILSGTRAPAGYFRATTWDEVMQCTDALRARGIEDFRRRRDILRAARTKVPPKQLELIGR